MNRIFQLLSFLINALIVVCDCEYEKFGGDHTMCKYTGQECDPITRGLSEKDKIQMLDLHNRIRSRIANGNYHGYPYASRMNELIWSKELEKIAQAWADQCRLGHDKNRKPRNYTSAGQNLFFNGCPKDTDPSMDYIFAKWIKEEKKHSFSRADIPTFHVKPNTAQFSQLIWGNTSAMGCGYIKFNRGKLYRQHVVCNYGPRGNIVGEAVYREGYPCSACDKGCSPRYGGLCDSDEESDFSGGMAVFYKINATIYLFYVLFFYLFYVLFFYLLLM